MKKVQSRLLLAFEPVTHSGCAATYVCIRRETALCASYGKEAPTEHHSVGPGLGIDVSVGHTAVCLVSSYLKTIGTYLAECPSSKAL